MTNIELEYMKLVPLRLKEIVEELRQLNETLRDVCESNSRTI